MRKEYIYLSATPPNKGLIIMPAIGTAQNTRPILCAVIPSCLPTKDLRKRRVNTIRHKDIKVPKRNYW